ncbi:MAG: hypothetical protein U1E17_18100 [Geminicoccaceae bacterium]
MHGLYALGDYSGSMAAATSAGQFDLTPIAIAEGQALAEALFSRNPQTVATDTLPTAIFSIRRRRR